MSTSEIQEMADGFARGFSRIIEKYRMVLTIPSEYEVELRSPGVLLSLGMGRRGYRDSELDIYVKYRQFFHPFYLRLLRNDFRVSLPKNEYQIDPLTYWIDRMRLLQDDLMPGCDDLLRGDPEPLVARDRYFEFVRFQNSYGDREESRRTGDWTYLRKPWEEYKRTLPAYVPRTDLLEGK